MRAPARLFVVDNHDSFTYNLVQYLLELGAEVTVRRNDEIDVEGALATNPDGVLVSPGPGRPATAGISKAIVARASGTIPLLGVCLGHQCIAEVFGADIVPAPRLMHGKTSPVIHRGEGVFAGLPSPFVATRYHSLVVAPKSVPRKHLLVTAWTDAGEIMGIRHRRHETWGVQFHPESILTRHGKRLVESFLRLCERPALSPAPATERAR